MKNWLIILLFLPLSAWAQTPILDIDFEDADISGWEQVPENRWNASDSQPITGQYSLQHTYDNANAAQDRISHSIDDFTLNGGKITWRFQLRYAYNPPGSNHWAIFLQANAPAAEMQQGGNVSGYVLGVNVTDTDDLLRLWKVTNGSFTEILVTDVDWEEAVSTDQPAAFEVFRYPAGQWVLKFDADGGFDDLELIGSTTDSELTAFQHFGVYYSYTSSQDQKLWFDDLNIQFQDLAPEILSVTPLDNSTLQLVFSEDLDPQTAENPNNYTLENAAGTPFAITGAALTATETVQLTTASLIPDDYELTVSNVSDLNGNAIDEITSSFTYLYLPQAGDIVITELFPDPTPPQQLPEEEFVEILNNSPYPVVMHQWTLTAGTTEKTIPNYTIEAGEYLILCDDDAASEFEPYGNVLPMESFISLTNSGQTVSITHSNGTVLNTVSYTDDWYQDPEKDDGGWTLERIDPDNTCSGMSNWRASENEQGGTPGTLNSVDAPNVDITAPELLSVSILSDSTLVLSFNETIVEAALLNSSNYAVNNGIGEAKRVETTDEPLTVLLTFANTFPQAQHNTLSVQNMPDPCGNIGTFSHQFTYYEAQLYDLVINEIMADESPAVELPEAEYVELYNNSSIAIDVSGWTLTYGNSQRELSAAVVQPGGYLIICNDDDVAAFWPYGNVAVVSSLSLTNSGQTLVLREQHGRIVSAVAYSDTWYRDEFKAEGGWALEQIDPENPCGGSENWRASHSETGGTPGAENTVLDSNPDVELPELIRAALISENELQLFFSEPVDSTTMLSSSNYTVDNAIGEPQEIRPVAPLFESVILTFDAAFDENTIYTISVASGLTDCIGNQLTNNSEAQFAVAQKAESNDVVINEILFNPPEFCEDYIELYNQSNKAIDLKALFLASRDATGEYESIKTITEESWLLFPGTYILLTTDAKAVENEYFTHDATVFLEVDALPSMSNESGNLLLMNESAGEVDYFEYHEDMHFQLLVDFDGVALERINPEELTNKSDNWHSAAEQVGFGTPGLQNSQYRETQAPGNDNITVAPEIFSPDNDGYNDVLTIGYHFEQPGYVANIRIFDSKGRQVRYLKNNELLATEGQFIWDGLNEDHLKAPIGIYIVFVEIFNLEGEIRSYKKTCVLAGKL